MPVTVLLRSSRRSDFRDSSFNVSIESAWLPSNMLLVSTTRIIPGRAASSFLSGRYSAVKVRKKLYVTSLAAVPASFQRPGPSGRQSSCWKDYWILGSVAPTWNVGTVFVEH